MEIDTFTWKLTVFVKIRTLCFAVIPHSNKYDQYLPCHNTEQFSRRVTFFGELLGQYVVDISYITSISFINFLDFL